MSRFALLPLLAIATPAFVTPAFAQAEPGSAAPADNAAPEDESEIPVDGSEIVVVATRLMGQVVAPQPPLITLDEEDIASYGASSITDLISSLSTQTNSSRGRGDGFPVILINGQRISSFREMRNLPPEAIRRMEVLPEEVALRYGYPPNQRVINFILKDNFASKTVEVEYHTPTDGGFDTLNFEGSMFRTAGKSRLNLTVSADDTSPLTEGERGVIQQNPPIAGDLNPGDYRTLVADSRNFGFNGTWTTPLGSGANAAGLTLNAAASTSRNTSFSGLASASAIDPGSATGSTTRYFAYPLMRESETDTYQAGLNLNKPLGSWRLTATADASTATTTTVIGKRPNILGTVTAAGPLPSLAPTGDDIARVTNKSVTSLVTLVGQPFRLPAGDVSATVKAGFAYTGLVSNDSRTSTGETRLNRGDLSAGLNLSLPLTSRRENVLPGIGDLTLNLSGGIDRLSDFGTLFDYSVGLTWGVTDKLNLQASYIVDQEAPALTNLGNPPILTDNVAVYDFTRRETALVTVTTGGNRDLRQEVQRDMKFSANWQLPFLKNSSVLIEYIRNNSDDVTAGFPLLTPAIEAAFRTRVRRCTNAPTDPVGCIPGQLLSIDQRPVTFTNEKSSRLRYGFNINGTIGKAPPPREGGFGGMGGGRPGGGPRGAGPRGGGGGFGRGGGGPGGPFGGGAQGQGRWNLAIYHTVRFDETVLVAPGGPTLDLLNGDALSGGGVSRHSLEVEGGAFYKGIGFRANGTWSAPTTVRGDTLLGTSDLRFGSVFKLNVRAFVNLDQQKKILAASPFFKGSRLSLTVDNLFNSRQRVTDAAGQVPLSYQPDLVDPRGRVIGIEFRKQF